MGSGTRGAVNQQALRPRLRNEMLRVLSKLALRRWRLIVLWMWQSWQGPFALQCAARCPAACWVAGPVLGAGQRAAVAGHPGGGAHPAGGL